MCYWLILSLSSLCALTLSFFTTHAFLPVLHDHSLRGFISDIVILPTIIHLFTDTDPLVPLVCHLALLIITRVHAHLSVCCIWVECPSYITEFMSVDIFKSSAFHSLLSEVLFFHYWCLPDALCAMCFKSNCLCHPNFV